MDKKINVLELLKDCSSGMELDCTLCDNVTFAGIDNNNIVVERSINRNKIYLSKWGTFFGCNDAKCVIFPKGKNTWKGFVPPCKFKDGDIVATASGRWIGITTTGGSSGDFIPTYCVIKYNDEFKAYFGRKWSFDRLATEEEKQKLFQAIKDNGYKWNVETKTLEKLVDDKDCPFDAAQLLQAQDVIKWLAENRCASINTINLFESAAGICFNIACKKVTEKRDHSKIKRKK